MWPLEEFSDAELLAIPTTMSAEERKDWITTWERMVGFHRHEDGLLNARFQTFMVATAFMMAAMAQFRDKEMLLIAWCLCLGGLVLTAVAYRVLSRTARTIEWYLDALCRLDQALFPSNQQLYASRLRHLAELQTRKKRKLPPVSIMLGAWVPAGVACVWFGLAILLGVRHNWHW